MMAAIREEWMMSDRRSSPSVDPTLVLSARALAAAVIFASPGCNGLCTKHYESCTTEKGLRYVACSEFRHEFNDGETFDDENDAYDDCSGED